MDLEQSHDAWEKRSEDLEALLLAALYDDIGWRGRARSFLGLDDRSESVRRWSAACDGDWTGTPWGRQ